MTDNDKIKHWDNMYQMPLEKIPWEIQEPPKELVELVENNQIKAGLALDIACGTGNYSFYLAKNGFDVIGIDFSKRAISIAIRNAEKLKLPVHFIVGDVTKIGSYFPTIKFNFILDYSILHHLDPSVINRYARQCYDLLEPKGRLMLVCYSDKDEFSGGNANATGTYGNTMFYHSADEIRKSYSDLREINYQEVRLGKRQHHIAHYFLFEKS